MYVNQATKSVDRRHVRLYRTLVAAGYSEPAALVVIRDAYALDRAQFAALRAAVGMARAA